MEQFSGLSTLVFRPPVTNSGKLLIEGSVCKTSVILSTGSVVFSVDEGRTFARNDFSLAYTAETAPLGGPLAVHEIKGLANQRIFRRQCLLTSSVAAHLPIVVEARFVGA